MNKVLIFCLATLLCCVLSGLLHAQPGSRVLAASKKAPEWRLYDLLDEESNRDLEAMSNVELSRHFNLVASCYFYLREENAAQYYLTKSLEYDPSFICHFTRLNVKRDIPEASYLAGSDPKAYYVSQMSDSFTTDFFKRCETCCDGGKEKVGYRQVDRSKLDSEILAIRNRDMKYRSDFDDPELGKQNGLDEINREKLDDLFDEYEMRLFSSVNDESLTTIWLVLHHSEDCKWNSIWVERCAKAVQAGAMSIGFLPLTIERFYGDDSGLCMKRKKRRTRKWLELMKSEYDSRLFSGYKANNQ